jgi:hypothetical protein
MCTDALQREESCGAHFREEYQTEDGEAVRGMMKTILMCLPGNMRIGFQASQRRAGNLKTLNLLFAAINNTSYEGNIQNLETRQCLKIKAASKDYVADGLNEDMSFLEALDHFNEQLVLCRMKKYRL